MTTLQHLWLLSTVYFCYLPFAEPVSLPASFKVCPRASPNLAKCVMEAIELIRPSLKSGNFGNGFLINALEPLTIDDFNIQRENGLFTSLSNLKATGAMNFKIKKLRIGVVPSFKLDMLVDMPKIEALGNYKLNMILGVLQLQGNGIIKANIESVKMRIAVHGSTYLKNGADYLKADRVEIALKIINMKMHLDNLFNGDKVLGDLGNSLINQNQHLFLKDFEPNLQTSLEKHFLKAVNQIFEKAPLDVFLP